MAHEYHSSGQDAKEEYLGRAMEGPEHERRRKGDGRLGAGEVAKDGQPNAPDGDHNQSGTRRKVENHGHSRGYAYPPGSPRRGASSDLLQP